MSPYVLASSPSLSRTIKHEEWKSLILITPFKNTVYFYLIQTISSLDTTALHDFSIFPPSAQTAAEAPHTPSFPAAKTSELYSCSHLDRPLPRRIRIVKGAYQEPAEYAMSRSAALDERYLPLVQDAIHRGHRVSIATHDERIINEAINLGLLDSGSAEFEMLYGIRPELSAKLQSSGYPVRIYVTYGHEWFLYLCHRIAEYPPNLYRAVVAMASDETVEPYQAYIGTT